jgi:hypothetical protein
MQVARELIEQDQQRQPALRRLGPGIQRAGFGQIARGAEIGAGRVERRILLEPHLSIRRGGVGEPELQNIDGARHGILARRAGATPRSFHRLHSLREHAAPGTVECRIERPRRPSILSGRMPILMEFICGPRDVSRVGGDPAVSRCGRPPGISRHW